MKITLANLQSQIKKLKFKQTLAVSVQEATEIQSKIKSIYNSIEQTRKETMVSIDEKTISLDEFLKLLKQKMELYKVLNCLKFEDAEAEAERISEATKLLDQIESDSNAYKNFFYSHEFEVVSEENGI
jgi:hypothetical protein